MASVLIGLFYLPNVLTLLTAFGSYIKPEGNHIAVTHDVIFPFEANLSRLTSFCQGTGGDQVVIGNRFCRDKTALEIRMDGSGGGRRFVASVNGP